MNKRHFWRRFWRYYKWHILFLLLIAVCLLFLIENSAQVKEPDISICYVGKNYINVQTFEDNKTLIESSLHDANEDDERVASISAYPADTEGDLLEYFEGLVEKDNYDIFISERNAFTKFEDKSVFVTSTDYVQASKLAGMETLKDENGRIYAVSLEECSFTKYLGIFDATDLFIAAVAPTEDVDSVARKNGRNIAGLILTEE